MGNFPFSNSQPGTQLAVVNYAPVAQQTYIATTTMTALDTTNATIKFNVPPSGNFYIDVCIDWLVQFNAGFGPGVVDLFLGIFLHGSSTLLSPIQSVGGTGLLVTATQSSGIGGRTSAQRFYSTGNTPGPIQVDLACGIPTTTDAQGAFYVENGSGSLASDPDGPLFIQAFAA